MSVGPGDAQRETQRHEGRGAAPERQRDDAPHTPADDVSDQPRPAAREEPRGNPVLTAQAVVGLLATRARLRVVAAVVLGAGTPTEVAAATGLSEAEASTAVNRLVRGRLINAVDGRFAVNTQVIADAARAGAPKREPDDYGVSDPKVAAVLHAFLVDGRLIRIPAAGRKRTAVLEYLVATFEPGRRYPEREVNVILASFHPDTAALRRYLVDEGFLSRAGGMYWRTGGWVDVL